MKRTTIIVDIIHFPNVNLLKPAINILKKKGFRIIITTQRRGRLPEIVKKEYPGYEIFTFGSHTGTIFSILFNANILRFYYMLYYIFKFRPKLGFSATSFPLEVAMGLLRIPNIQFEDDVERKYNFFFHKLFASKVFLPPILRPHGKFETFNALKEWSYLSPDYFSPDVEELKVYGLQEKQYILIREVSTGSFNYSDQLPSTIASFANKLPTNLKVILSLENKKNKNLFPNNWSILEEPVNDIHSLMYFSSVVISSGDSMAREGGLLGVPSIYCGVREMKANDILINEGILYKVNPSTVPEVLDRLLNGENHCNQILFRLHLKERWDDVTQIIISNCIKYLKSN